MRLRRVLAAACLLAVAGTMAPANAAPVATVRGRVVDDTGTPVRGALVTFRQLPGRTGLAGIACIVLVFFDPACSAHTKVTHTDAVGRYTFVVRLDKYEGTTGARDLIVDDVGGTAGLPAARTTTRVAFLHESMTVPDLWVWRGRASIDPFAAPTHRTVHADKPGVAFHVNGSPDVTLAQDGATVWTYRQVDRDRLVDARTVEAGTTSVRGRAVGLVQGLRVTYETRAYPVTNAVRPVSRGAKCWTYGAHDALLPYAGCAYTDGRLATVPDFAYARAKFKACTSASQCGHPNALLVDLGAPQVVSAFVLRGCGGSPTIETSVDGTLFTTYQGTTIVEPGLITGAPVPARYVRMSDTFCLAELSELSAFAPV